MPLRPRLAICSMVGCVSIFGSFLLSLIVCGATDVVVTRGGQDGGWFGDHFVEACDQDRFHRGIADSVVAQRPVAGGLQPFAAKPALKAQDPER
jgi:hypothetical protein